MAYAVIADNGGSDLRYKDIVGEVYTFPSIYVNLLTEGTKFVYQRCSVSSMRVAEPDNERLLDEAHYFGVAEIGPVHYVGEGLYEAQIINYKHFKRGVPFRLANGDHFENALGYFWRNGARATIKEVYDEIIKASEGTIPTCTPPSIPQPDSTSSTPKTSASKARSTVSRKPHNTVKTNKDLVTWIKSRTFSNDRFQVVTSKTGYWLYYLPDDKYFFLAPLDGNSYRVGDIKLNPRIESKEPLVKSETNFGISHTDGSDRYVIGSIEVSDDIVIFRSGRLGNSTTTIYL